MSAAGHILVAPDVQIVNGLSVRQLNSIHGGSPDRRKRRRHYCYNVGLERMGAAMCVKRRSEFYRNVTA